MSLIRRFTMIAATFVKDCKGILSAGLEILLTSGAAFLTIFDLLDTWVVIIAGGLRISSAGIGRGQNF